jgi:integrase
MTIEIDKAGVRKALAPRREPYWTMRSKGRFIGYRKISAECGSWIARMRNEDGKQLYHALGSVTAAFDYDAAVAAAAKWFKAKDRGISDEPITVREACRLYVADRRREKSEACAADAEARFRRYVNEAEIGNVQIARIKSSDLKAWRAGLGLSKASANRYLISLRAVLNFCVSDKLVDAAVAGEWRGRAVKLHSKADGQRKLFLDLSQRRALLNSATGSIRDLIEAALLTGARPGELVRATRGQFDARTGVMTFAGKTGPRVVALPPAALALFTRMAKSKLPPAPLFMNDDGDPWVSHWGDEVRKAAKAAKLPVGTCLYTCRHSFITQAITDGISVLDVAKFTGTSLAMIEDFYGQFVKSAARERLAMVQML